MKNNLWRIVWIVGVYAILVTILYLVIIYKVKWESKDLNTYLYFYKCSNQLCTSTENQNNYYNRILCDDNICPYIKEINGENLILSKNNKSYIYNYIDDKIINNKYIDYNYIGNGNYSVSNENNKYGLIDENGNILVDFNYEFITGYKDEYISIKKNNKYGIINENQNINIEAIYDDIILIDDKIYSYKLEGKYYFNSYDEKLSNKKTYDFVYVTDSAILVISDKTIDILDYNLKSRLIMKIDTYYAYKTEKERDSLEIYHDSDYMYFSICSNNNECTNYRYDLKKNKLI